MPSETEHVKKLNDLVAARMAVVKSINDTEDLMSNREAELVELNEEERKLNRTDASAEHDLDSTTYALGVPACAC